MDETRDGITLLKDQHREMIDLFTEIESATDLTVKRELFDRVSILLAQHAMAEEELLYPLARRTLADGEELVEHALDEHQEVKETLARLEKMSTDNIEFDTELRTLMANVREHISEEEGELLVDLAQQLDQDELDTLGTNLAAAEQLAPTRPHPNAPNRPPFNVVAGAGAAVVDRARDAVTGRGKDS